MNLNLVQVDFYCDDCKLDRKLWALKSVLSSGEEYFQTKCPNCRRKLVRYITQRHLDPYYLRSKKLKMQRGEFAKDLIQPGQFGFKTLYPKAYANIEKANEEYERKLKTKEAEKVAIYNKYKHDMDKRNSLKKVFDWEEQHA